MSSPTLGPCQCCQPNGVNPKGAWVTIQGIKNWDYPECVVCDDLNVLQVDMPFPAEGCTASYHPAVCGVETVLLELIDDPDDVCRKMWNFRIEGDPAGIVQGLRRGGVVCCYERVTLGAADKYEDVEHDCDCSDLK